MSRNKARWIGVSSLLLFLSIFASRFDSWRGFSWGKLGIYHAGKGSDESAKSSTESGKFKVRPVSLPSPTHLPEALPRFYLPSIRIDQMSLGDSLDLILSKYNEACEQSGEVPLRIRFQIPPAEEKRISLVLDGMSFDRAMTLLAAVSGLDVKRSGVTYKFLELQQSRDISDEKTVRVSPDIAADLAKFLGTDGGTIHEVISGSGLLSDSDVVISTGERGSVTIKEGTASDREIISNLLTKFSAKKHIQHRVKAKVVELPHGFDLGVPDGSVLPDSELQVLMRNLAMSEETKFLSMPTMVTLPDLPGEIEIGNEIVVPKPGVVDPGSADDFTSFIVGKSMSVRMSPLGFGQELAFRYEDSDVNEAPGEVLSKREIVSSKASGFQMDNGTKMTISRKDDGGYVATFVTATLVDATGRPISQSEDWRDTYRE